MHRTAEMVKVQAGRMFQRSENWDSIFKETPRRVQNHSLRKISYISDQPPPLNSILSTPTPKPHVSYPQNPSIKPQLPLNLPNHQMCELRQYYYLGCSSTLSPLGKCYLVPHRWRRIRCGNKRKCVRKIGQPFAVLGICGFHIMRAKQRREEVKSRGSKSRGTGSEEAKEKTNPFWSFQSWWKRKWEDGWWSGTTGKLVYR